MGFFLGGGGIPEADVWGQLSSIHEVGGRVGVAGAVPPADGACLGGGVDGGRTGVGTERYRPDGRHEPRRGDGDEPVAARESAVRRTLRTHRLVPAAVADTTCQMHACRHVGIRYDTIRDAIFTCAKKPT